MKILIATPLYPPDIAGHAPYVKELASRLKNMHEVTIVAYNHIPERIDGVHIIVVEKQLPLPVRIIKYAYMLFIAARRADVVYLQNGASTELPMILISHLTSTPFTLRLGDEVPLCYAEKNIWHRLLLHAALWSARKVIVHTKTSVCLHTLKMSEGLKNKMIDVARPLIRPEVLPFQGYPLASFEEYESSWVQHVNKLNTLFTL